MKNLVRYTFALLATLVATSFTSQMVEGKAIAFTVNGLKVIPKSSVKEIMSTKFLIKGGTANHSAESSIDSTFYGNYRITDHHQLGIDRFIMDDGRTQY